MVVKAKALVFVYTRGWVSHNYFVDLQLHVFCLFVVLS